MTKLIEDGNKTLMEFMGGTKDGEKSEWFKYGDAFHNQNELEFHGNWEWLMPVVIKIESLPEKYIVSIFDTVIKILKVTTEEPILETIVNVTYNDKRMAIWKSCVEFVEWYKRQK